MSAANDVRDASNRFYAALNRMANGDAGGMADVWSHGATGHLVLGGQKVRVDHRVTNVYRRENGAWKIVHHHTDLSPAMLDVLRALQAKGQ